MPTFSIGALDFEATKFSRACGHAEASRTLAPGPINHPSHTFGTVDDCIRCLDCEMLFGGLKSGQVCPAAIERASFEAAFNARLYASARPFAELCSDDDQLRDAGRGHLASDIADGDVPFGHDIVSMEPMTGGSGPAEWFGGESCPVAGCTWPREHAEHTPRWLFGYIDLDNADEPDRDDGSDDPSARR